MAASLPPLLENDAMIESALEPLAPTKAALATLRRAVRDVALIPRGRPLLEDGHPRDTVNILCWGLAKSYQALPQAGQQTLALFVPGDVLDADVFLLGRANTAVAAITPCRVAQIGHADFRGAIDVHPEIGWAIMRNLARERALLQEWLTGLGRRQARARTAHLICEIAARVRGENGDGEAFDFPLTQIELADLLGLSSVHVNRVLQQLRAEGLVDLARGRLAILNRARLEAVAGFDATYLEGG